MYESPHGSAGGPPPFSPQPPPPVYNGLGSQYDPTLGFAPVCEISVLTSTTSPAVSALDALTLAASHAAAALLSTVT